MSNPLVFIPALVCGLPVLAVVLLVAAEFLGKAADSRQ